MIQFEYDQRSCGVKVSFILRDGRLSETNSLHVFDFEPNKRDGKRQAKMTRQNLRCLGNLVRMLEERCK
jgi:hypothetical protein